MCNCNEKCDTKNTSNNPFDRLINNLVKVESSIVGLPTEVVDSEKTLNIFVEAPGVKASNFDISFDNGVVKITVVKDDKPEGKVFINERSFGTFSRVIPVGNNINVDDVDVTYVNGVLNIALPKKDNKVKFEVKTDGDATETEKPEVKNEDETTTDEKNNTTF